MNKKSRKKVVKNNSSLNTGVIFYNEIGKVLISCGIISLLLLWFVSIMPQDYEKYNISLYMTIWIVISLILIVIGVIPLILGKYSRKYQVWIDKEVKSFKKKNSKA